MYRLQVRRDTAANWASANPILLAGEIGAETDTAKWKLGDGVTVWNSLAYAVGAKGDTGDPGGQGEKGDTGAGVPPGGTAGQVLAKNSATDGDAGWVDQSGGAPINSPNFTGTPTVSANMIYHTGNITLATTAPVSVLADGVQVQVY